MEMEKPKKKTKRKGQKVHATESVPLHDILNTDNASEDSKSPVAASSLDDSQLKSEEAPMSAEESRPKKKKKEKKNVIAPENTSTTNMDETDRPTSAASSRQGAWQNEGQPMESNDDTEPIISAQEQGTAGTVGIVNPALTMTDEVVNLPGSVPNLQDETLDSFPIVNNTVIEEVGQADENLPTPEELAKLKEDVGTPKSRPTTPRSAPGTPASKFHRTLFGSPKSKITPVSGKENLSRPSTAPGHRLPFITDFSPSPSQKRPATAAAAGSREAKTGRMEGSQRSLQNESIKGSRRSLKEAEEPELASPKQAVAYVPYMHARNALTRVIEDMKNMKMNHLSIVAQIEEQYHGIENDSKKQFNTFVLSLQEDQNNKINTFRQTIETHNLEIKERDKYWTETLQSLSKRNKELLRQKRALLLAYRKDTQILEEERNSLQSQLLGQIGVQDSKLRQLEDQLEDSRDEVKISSDVSDSEKVSLVHAVPVAAALATDPSRRIGKLVDNEAQTDGDFTFASMAAVDVGDSKWKERYEKEREEHHEESERLERELQAARALLASSGSSTEEERKVYEDKIKELSKNLAQTKLEYDTTYGFLQAVMAATNSEEQFQKAKEKIDGDRAIMLEEQERIKKDIKDWEEKWKKNQNGNLPSEDERPDAAQELYTQLAEVEQVLSGLDQQEQALIMLREGRLPEPSKEAPEPMVTTIQVRDPELVTELESSKSQVLFLENKLKTAEEDSLRISDLENENSDLRDKLNRYEAELEEVRRNPPLAAAVAHTAVSRASPDKSHRSIDDRDAATLLQAVLNEIEVVHQELRKAPHKVEKRIQELKEKEELKLKEKELESGSESSDESAEAGEKQTLHEIQLSLAAAELIKSGELPEDMKTLVPKDSSEGTWMLQEELEEARKQADLLQMQLDEAQAGGGFSARVDIGEDGGDLEDLNQRLEEYQKQIDELEEKLREEKETAEDLRAETGQIQSELDKARLIIDEEEREIDARVVAATAALTLSLKEKNDELKEATDRMEELERARLENLDVDSRAEVERAQKETKLARTNVTKLKKEREEIELKLAAKEQKVKSQSEKITVMTTQEVSFRAEIESTRKAKQKAVKECETKFAEKERKRKAEDDAKFKMLENKIRRLEAAGAIAGGASATKRTAAAAPDPNIERKMQRLETQIVEYKKHKSEDQNRIKEMDRELKEAKLAAKSVAGDKERKLVEKKVKELEKKLEMETRKFERELKRANELTEELEHLKKEFSELEKKHRALTEECQQLTTAAEAGVESAAKVVVLEKETKHLTSEVKTLTDNYNSERVLRKKYYNMVEDMKGKIRVYCRYRPMSKTESGNGNVPVVKTPDEYTIQVEARGSTKEFQFDQIFTDHSTQEEIFEDTFNLVQSAVDGYNVCIFAYGQTGSGKTYTMIGDGAQTQPGVAPRAFKRIFDLIEENKSKMRFEVSCYMLELYNEKLLDLLGNKNDDSVKMDIKKDKKGMVYVQNATIQKAQTAEELYSIFEKGSSSRHVASTKMNAESSRSHLVVAVIMESVNLTTGAVTRGKLSLVDLAGSERVGKTGATAQQLKEANSINKSLSALGDVISALSSEQSFIPYRNNKLTMLMQDSIGGNAKTLMFVNISPADYNADETAISLTYASRVKLITNDASKNADSREVARLRTIISKLKAGESIEEDE